MSDKLELVLYPDPLLRKPTEKVAGVTDEIRALIPRMIETMHESRGLGLAANQVGLSIHLALISDTGEDADIRVAINAEVIEEDGALAMEEGCLSFPELTGLITRAERVKVRYLNLDGEIVEEETAGLLARCFLHEIDHLNGIMFISKMTPADRMRLKRPLKELEEDYEAQKTSRATKR
jgi:peptide deformylase